MKYKPELGFFGNLERAFAELNKTNSRAFNTQHQVDQTTALVETQLGGQVSRQAAEQQRKVLQMFAASLSQEQAMEVATIFEPWAVGRIFSGGEYFTFGFNTVGDPQLYRVNDGKPHTAQADWMPGTPETASLYTAIGLDDSGYPVWSQPTGAHDAYNTGDVVNYNGTLYRSTVDGNTHSPDAYPAGWEIYVEEVQRNDP